MIPGLSELESDVIEDLRAHVAHGHGLMTITVKPGSVRVQSGKGRLYEFGTNGNKREKQDGPSAR